MGDFAFVLAAVVQHRLELRTLSGSRRFGVSKRLINGEAVTFAAICAFAFLSRQVLNLVCLFVGGDSHIENGAIHFVTCAMSTCRILSDGLNTTSKA